MKGTRVSESDSPVCHLALSSTKWRYQHPSYEVLRRSKWETYVKAPSSRLSTVIWFFFGGGRCKGNESLGLLHAHLCSFTHSKYRLSYQLNFRVEGLYFSRGNHYMRGADPQKLFLPYKPQSHKGSILTKLKMACHPGHFGLWLWRVSQSHGSIMVFVFPFHIIICFGIQGNKHTW